MAKYCHPCESSDGSAIEQTLLHIAVIKAFELMNIENVIVLLQLGFPVDVINSQGESVLDCTLESDFDYNTACALF